ncbi:hypothetical protein Pcinc_043748 [Petrolisthes cinctipes]|uniref:Uncharacterized protein n=1 Tax=Petrolisthes cinctipes TaxID=88211 RepID=A0AAE1BF12_PETCI|nr:hypothetical protein Pcinc_043748 [Petrolisthes cinctipes]
MGVYPAERQDTEELQLNTQRRKTHSRNKHPQPALTPINIHNQPNNNIHNQPNNNIHNQPNNNIHNQPNNSQTVSVTNTTVTNISVCVIPHSWYNNHSRCI